MKKVLEIKGEGKGIFKVRLEATKRITLYFEINTSKQSPCDHKICPLYYDCVRLKSPLKKFSNFGDFCCTLFVEYPSLKTELGVKSITEVFPIKIGKL